MKCKYSNRLGLTLLELVVVMVILVALAGILVPMLPNMLGKAHSSSHATNVVELLKVVEVFNTVNHGYPDRLESLIDSTGKLYAKLPGITTSQDSACGGEVVLATAALSTDQLKALNSAGVSTLYQMSNGVTDATFQSYTTTALTLSSANLATLSTTAATRLYPSTTNGTFVVFGVGPQSSVVGRGGMAEPPVHFSDAPGDKGNPSKTYGRYGLVFNVGSTASVLETAQFMGVVAFHEDAVGGSGSEGIEEFYKN